MRKRKYHEGDVTAVPLTSGGFGVAVIARVAPQGKIAYGYLFKMRLKDASEQSDPLGLDPRNSVLQLRFGDLGIIKGEWPIIGRIPNWNRAEWPMVAFARRDDLSRQAWKVTYSDTDPSARESEVPCAYESDLPRDALFGSGAVETTLTQIVNS